MHREILSPEQRRILPSLVQAVGPTGFYLAGGTALALRIGHRPSIDFDWFAPSSASPLYAVTGHPICGGVIGPLA